MNKTRHRLQAFNGSKQMSFLPEPDYNPILPSKNTLAFRALCLMLQGKKISHPNFQGKTSSWRLAAHIGKLKKLGWPIETISVKYTSPKKPIKRNIHRYFLNERIIKKLKTLSGGVYDKRL